MLSLKYNTKKHHKFLLNKRILSFLTWVNFEFATIAILQHVTRRSCKIIFCESTVRRNQFLCLNENFTFNNAYLFTRSKC